MPIASQTFELRHYTDEHGFDLFGQWLEQITSLSARAAIAARLIRLEHGLMGDCKPLQACVWELRVHLGAGWRVYFAKEGQQIVLLLAGSDKSHQKTGIALTVKRWAAHQERHKPRKIK